MKIIISLLMIVTTSLMMNQHVFEWALLLFGSILGSGVLIYLAIKGLRLLRQRKTSYREHYF
jgi:hypothetical protein